MKDKAAGLVFAFFGAFVALVLLLHFSGALAPAGGGGARVVVQEEGAFVGVRPILNCIGASVACTEDAAGNRINLSVAAVSPGLAFDLISDYAYTLYGVGIIDASLFTVASGTVYYQPIWVTVDQPVDTIGVSVNGAGLAPSVCRLGIYAADVSWQPGALVVDAGTVDTALTGFRSVTGLSTVLSGTQGRYLATNVCSATPQMRVAKGQPPNPFLNADAGVNVAWQNLRTPSGTLNPNNPLPANGVDWTLHGTNQQGIEYAVRLLECTACP